MTYTQNKKWVANAKNREGSRNVELIGTNPKTNRNSCKEWRNDITQTWSLPSGRNSCFPHKEGSGVPFYPKKSEYRLLVFLEHRLVLLLEIGVRRTSNVTLLHLTFNRLWLINKHKKKLNWKKKHRKQKKLKPVKKTQDHTQD